jgi:hypothetical protein
MKIVALALASFLAPTGATLCPSTDACDGDCSGTYDGYATSTIVTAGGNNTNRGTYSTRAGWRELRSVRPRARRSRRRARMD